MNVLRMLGIACLPVEAEALIPADDRILVCEHLFCSVTLRNFRAPGRACNWKRQWFAGSIAVSEDRIIAFRGRRRLINTPFDDPRFCKVSFTADEYILYIAHDAALYHDDWSGQIEYRFRTLDAQKIATIARDAVSRSAAVTS